jgi:hypothetical protein
MKRLLVLFGVLLFVMSLIACEKDRVVDPQAEVTNTSDRFVDPEGTATQIMAMTNWPAASEDGSAIALNERPSGPHGGTEVVLVGRQTVVGDIVHYIFLVRTGPGDYDIFGLHRVVRESVPNKPNKTKKGVFLQHGDLKDFTGMFMPGVASPRQPDDVGLAVQLASSDIDVWGIDQAWTRIPEGLGDYSFLLDFGMDRCIDDLGSGIEIARVIRRMTGNGYRQMALLGYSSGSSLGFAFLNAESQLPRGHQKTCAYIPVDYGLKTDSEAWMQGARADMVLLDSFIQSGANRYPNPFAFFGPPALDDPDGPSELIEGMTNRQAAIALAAYPAYPAIPEVGYHFLAGVFDENYMPVDLQYTLFDNWVDFMIAAPPNEAVAFMRDYTMAALPEYEVPWDDHLSDVTTPILYVGAAGGGGPYGLHTLDLISSTDVTVLNFSFHPPEEILLDFAHIDLFLAEGAPSFVWTPVRDWILSHTP